MLSKDLCLCLGLTSEKSIKRKTTATGDKSAVLGALKNMPISLDDVVEPVDFIVIEGGSYEMIIGRPTMRKLNGVIYCVHKTFTLEKEGETVTVPLDVDYVQED